MSELTTSLHAEFGAGLPVAHGLVILKPSQLELLLRQVAEEAVRLALAALPPPATPQLDAADTNQELSTTEAARYLNVQPDTLLSYHKQGLPYRKGRPNHYKKADLDHFCQTRRVHYSPT